MTVKLDLRKRQNPLTLGERKLPTQKHRAAVWESMLGTVMAANPAGEARYFDYDYQAACKWAELKTATDLRTYRFVNRIRSSGVAYPDRPRRGQLVLWRAG